LGKVRRVEQRDKRTNSGIEEVIAILL